MESSTWDRHLIIRLPRFSMEYFQQGMEVIWRNPDFRNALLITAPSWISPLNWEQDFNDLPIKLQHTLWKYANRMCHRSTPFGAFTGMGVWTWQEKADLNIDPSAFETRFLKRSEHSSKVKPYLNNLAYPFGEGLRFFVQEKEPEGKPWKMKELPFLPDAQQLFTGQLNGHPHLSLLKETGLVQDQITEVSYDCVTFEQFKESDSGLSHTVYRQNGALHESYQSMLNQGIKVLEQLSRPVSSESFQQFKKAFQKRFEYRSVPILEALDPDLGVGYPVEIQERESSWSQAHRFLMEQWMNAKEEQKPILDLDATLVDELMPAADFSCSAPDSAVIFSVLNDQVWLKQVCPLGSIPLIARMIPFDPEVKDLVDGFIIRERKQQPEVIHADIIYQGEEVMDKVSLPYGLRPYQLVLSPDQGSHPEMLDWNDLLLLMEGNDLILYSLKYQRKVISHLNSAYNSQRDEMPLFRLLVDLQYEGLSLPAAFHLKHFFPGLSNYPRVSCSKVIIQPACWIIAGDLLKKWKGLKEIEEQIQCFQDYANEVKLARRFLWKVGDQGLVFDRNNKLDMEVFRSLWHKYPELILEEYLFDQGSALQGRNGRDHYAHELIAFRFQEGQRPQHRMVIADFSAEQEKVCPDWLSFYVYLEPEQQDRFIADHVLPVVKHQLLEIDFPFQQWHFLRFIDELGSHLRIRFKCSSGYHENAGWGMLQRWCEIPYVKKVSMHPYLPELSRYRYLGIRKTEGLFLKSSNSILLSMLHHDSQHRLAYALCSLWVVYLKSPGIKSEIEGLFDSSSVQHHTTYQWNNEFREIKPLLLKYYPVWSVKDPFLKFVARLDVPIAENPQAAAYFISIFHMHINRLFQTEQPETERCCYYLFPKLKALFEAKHLYRPADGKHSETFP